MNENNMTETTTVQETKEKTPTIQREHNGVQITITFSESVGEGDTKERVLNLLTNAYENRLRSSDHSETV